MEPRAKSKPRPNGHLGAQFSGGFPGFPAVDFAARFFRYSFESDRPHPWTAIRTEQTEIDRAEIIRRSPTVRRYFAIISACDFGWGPQVVLGPLSAVFEKKSAGKSRSDCVLKCFFEVMFLRWIDAWDSIVLILLFDEWLLFQN